MDFDHQAIATEKHDAQYTYKKFKGYFPGIATVGGLIVGVENRDGNANVRFCQEEMLLRIFNRLSERGITVERFRADCGSFSEDIIRTVSNHARHFQRTEVKPKEGENDLFGKRYVYRAILPFRFCHRSGQMGEDRRTLDSEYLHEETLQLVC